MAELITQFCRNGACWPTKITKLNPPTNPNQPPMNYSTHNTQLQTARQSRASVWNFELKNFNFVTKCGPPSLQEMRKVNPRSRPQTPFTLLISVWSLARCHCGQKGKTRKICLPGPLFWEIAAWLGLVNAETEEGQWPNSISSA